MSLPEGARVLATATLYGDREGLLALREALARQSCAVESFLVVDNSPRPLFSAEDVLVPHAGPTLILRHHPENLGVSGSLAAALSFARREGYTHVWCFDQDSVPASGALGILLGALEADAGAALACCLPRVAPDDSPLHGLVFDRFRFVRPLREQENGSDCSDSLRAYDCDASITSGTLVRLRAVEGVSLLTEELFIDGVDHDMGLRVRRAGLRVLVCPAAPMKHALGATEIVRTRFSARVLRLPHYSALRLYFICRNHTWVETRAARGAWKVASVAWRLKFMLWQMEVSLHENGPARARMRACVIGTLHGLVGRLGPAPKSFRQPQARRVKGEGGSGLTAAQVERKTLAGSVAILVRQVLGQGVNVLGQVLLAKWLSPTELGIYAIFLFLGGLYVSVAGNGVVTGIVRQPETPGADDLTSALRLQMGAGVLLAAGVAALSPWLVRHYAIETHGVLPVLAVAVSFVLLSCQGLAQARLERDLEFKSMAYVELAQLLVFNGVALLAAARGAGGVCYVYGLFARALVGAAAFNVLRPSLRFEGGRWVRGRALHYLRYGVPLQAIGLVSAAKDSIVPLVLGSVAGVAAVGHVSWATMVSCYPILLLMILQRLYLPAFARLHDDRETLGRLVENILLTTSTVVAPLAVAVLVLARPVTILVFDAKWLAALPLFPYLWFANVFTAWSGPLAALLNAKGRSHVSLLFAVLAMILTWALGAPLIHWMGELGFAVANVAVQFLNVWLIRMAMREAPFRFFRSGVAPWLLAAALALPFFVLVRTREPTSVIELGLYAAGYGLAFLCGAALFFGRRLRNAWAPVREDAGASAD